MGLPQGQDAAPDNAPPVRVLVAEADRLAPQQLRPERALRAAVERGRRASAGRQAALSAMPTATVANVATPGLAVGRRR